MELNCSDLNDSWPLFSFTFRIHYLYIKPLTLTSKRVVFRCITRRISKHITFVSEFWGRARQAVGSRRASAPIIDARLIALQLSDFQLAMSKSQYYGMETGSGLWSFISRNANLLQLVSEYAELAKLSLAIPMTRVG
jgi:hypothetical protein